MPDISLNEATFRQIAALQSLFTGSQYGRGLDQVAAKGAQLTGYGSNFEALFLSGPHPNDMCQVDPQRYRVRFTEQFANIQL